MSVKTLRKLAARYAPEWTARDWHHLSSRSSSPKPCAVLPAKRGAHSFALPLRNTGKVSFSLKIVLLWLQHLTAQAPAELLTQHRSPAASCKDGVYQKHFQENIPAQQGHSFSRLHLPAAASERSEDGRSSASSRCGACICPHQTADLIKFQ